LAKWQQVLGKLHHQHGIQVSQAKNCWTWANDHLWIAATCQQRPCFWGPILNFYNMELPPNNDHLSPTATNFRSQGWWLYTGLTVPFWGGQKIFRFFHWFISGSLFWNFELPWSLSALWWDFNFMLSQ